MKRKIIIVIIILLQTLLMYSTSMPTIEQIQKNLSSRLSGKPQDINEVALLLWKLNYIAKTLPIIKITPEAIIVNSNGKVILSDSRTASIIWKPESMTNNLLHITATLKPQLVEYTVKQPSMNFGISAGISYFDNAFNGGALLTYRLFHIWKIGISVGVGYPGIILGLNINLYKELDFLAGYGLVFSDKLKTAVFIGVNTRIF